MADRGMFRDLSLKKGWQGTSGEKFGEKGERRRKKGTPLLCASVPEAERNAVRPGVAS